MYRISSNNQKIAKNTVYLTIRMIFVMFVSLYTSSAFLNVLGVEDYGIMNVVAGFVSMFTFIKASLSNATQRFYNYEMGLHGESAISEVYSVSIIIQFVIGLVVVLLLETVGLWYLYSKMVIPDQRLHIAFWLFQLSTLSSFITIVQIPYLAAVMAYEKMNFYAIISIIEALLKLGFAFLIPYVPIDKLLSFGCFTFGSTVFVFLLNYFYCRKKFPFLRIIKVSNRNLYKKMLSFTGWNAFGSFSISIREQGLNMILNLFYGPVINSARAVSYQVTSALSGLVQTLSIAARPQITQSYAKGDLDRSMHLMFSISKLGYILMFLMTIPIVLEAPYILSLWLGSVVPEYSVSFIRIIIFTSLINTLTAQISTMVHASGNMRRYQIVTSLFCLLVLPLSYFYLKNFSDPTMVYVIMFGVISVNYIISLYILSTITKFSVMAYIKQVMLPLFVTSLIASVAPIIVHYQMNPGVYRLLIVTFVSVVSIILTFYCFSLSKEEKQSIKKIIKR